jgi:hypothetical protein
MPSLRNWFWNLLNHGEAPQLDPDEVVEAAYVTLPAAAIVIVRLREAGIPSSSVETRQGAAFRGTPMAQIFCRRGDLQRAQPIIDDVTTLSGDDRA